MPSPPDRDQLSLRRLHALIRRVNSSTDAAEILDEVVTGVVEVLGYGVAVISRVDGDELLTTSVAGSEEVKSQLVGRRTSIRSILDEFNVADEWGVLRFVPHDRIPADIMESAWVPDLDYSGEEGEWHPLDALYAPLYSGDGKLLGNMAVDLPPGNRIPSREQAEMLEMFVVQAGLALAHVRQREVLADQVRFAEAARTVSSSYQIGRIHDSLGHAAQLIASGLGARRVWISVLGDRVEDLTGDRLYCCDPAKPRPAAWDDIVAALERHTWSTETPWLLDATSEQRPQEARPVWPLLSAEECDRFVAVPLQIAQERLGYLVVASRNEGASVETAALDAIRQMGTEVGRILLTHRAFEAERRLVSELQEVDRYKSELIATISHELKTPLASIIGHVELLEDLDTGAGSVEVISRNAARLNELINNLLLYSSVQERRRNERIQVDLLQVAQDGIEAMQWQASAANLRLGLHTKLESAWVMGDHDEITRVVENLLSNAMKYTAAGGEVDFIIESSGDAVRLRCRDNGLGISANDLKHLFSAFFRSSNPVALSIPGTGLGLAISRRIAEMHGGSLGVDSQLGVGSTFTLTLPALEV